MKSEVQEVIQRVEVAERVVSRLKQASTLDLDEGTEERRWLEVAEGRLATSAELVRKTLEESLMLPELESIRKERQGRLEQEWHSALCDLFGDLLRNLGETSPLLEALFPHRRFDKLERGGAVLNAYREQFATRRASGYVRRMAEDPDYAFLPPLLARMDRATEALTANSPPSDLTEDTLAELRRAVVESGESLKRSLRQARALAEAALIDYPERLAELGFDERPRKRGSGEKSLEGR